MKRWEQVEWESGQRLLGALAARHGWAINEETEEQARVLAFVVLAPLRTQIEQLLEDVVTGGSE